MLTSEHFSFASAPRTGAKWFVEASQIAGIAPTLNGDDSREPPPAGHSGIVLSIVRHPFDWLDSMWAARWSFDVIDETAPYFYFLQLMRPYTSVEYFIRAYIHTSAGLITKMFDSYRPTSVIRLEDFPWAAIDFFDCAPLDTEPYLLHQIQKHRPVNQRTNGHCWNAELKRAVSDAEREFCERYQYI